jgi:toxin ParE1/3/4
MANQYHLSNQALDDLNAIWDFGAERWGRNKANSYATNIHNMCEFIASNMGLGKKRDEIFEGMKSYAVGSHVLFYIEQGEVIYVSRILHKSMDFERHFFN